MRAGCGKWLDVAARSIIKPHRSTFYSSLAHSYDESAPSFTISCCQHKNGCDAGDRCSPAVSLLWDFDTRQAGDGASRGDGISSFWGCQSFPVAMMALEGQRDRGHHREG